MWDLINHESKIFKGKMEIIFLNRLWFVLYLLYMWFNLYLSKSYLLTYSIIYHWSSSLSSTPCQPHPGTLTSPGTMVFYLKLINPALRSLVCLNSSIDQMLFLCTRPAVLNIWRHYTWQFPSALISVFIAFRCASESKCGLSTKQITQLLSRQGLQSAKSLFFSRLLDRFCFWHTLICKSKWPY